MQTLMVSAKRPEKNKGCFSLSTKLSFQIAPFMSVKVRMSFFLTSLGRVCRRHPNSCPDSDSCIRRRFGNARTSTFGPEFPRSVGDSHCSLVTHIVVVFFKLRLFGIEFCTFGLYVVLSFYTQYNGISVWRTRFGNWIFRGCHHLLYCRRALRCISESLFWVLSRVAMGIARDWLIPFFAPTGQSPAASGRHPLNWVVLQV